ncbi:hypothetical protein P9Y62_24545 [Bacillus thuringiensis]|uniref:Uncharacterized protein n=1 Tax=Bacillus thuringiensis TaxID=1428 RepID=A0A9X5N8A0_BACTU|nr:MULTISPECIES: hypothetical protein [Bacillus cereus group]EEM38242.1 hypothetical protein bthur0004_58830 [Bacillus thuringiensis serovar sotto str. T04001]MBJ8090296.1 hypothetical protein [Bacillus cereus]MEB4894885.1 hypothetical protein [Bacillus thuringiensis]MEC2565344.1 hypothetical protein [Bacillus thuringiensis]MEC2643806.1 hypothetical protein [Bacillus thuringiensis]
MLDKNQSKVVLPSWVWEGVKNEREAKSKAIEYINPDRYPGYKIIKIEGDIAVCERVSV